jgi:hypothetical protein
MSQQIGRGAPRLRRVPAMTRSVCGALLLAVLAAPAPADGDLPPPKGSTADNPLPASGVQIGTTFTYSDYTLTVVDYGWIIDGYPYVLVQDSYDGSYYWVSMGGAPLSVKHPRPGSKAGDKTNQSIGFTIKWDGPTDTILVITWSSDLIDMANYYGPIPYWLID